VKLATYNLNGIRARLPRLIEWLDREKPDVVCLQELKCADESLPIADIEATGYGAVWHGQKGFNGVAILARGDTPQLRRTGLPRRQRGRPEPLHRGGGRRTGRRLALSAERQSRGPREVRV
jgi:exonuclease III